ncbi:MAG: site-2 protease family protein [Verrucomicrobiota bacterium]
MFRFSIFGIPVEVQPFFWVITALLGGATGADSKEAFLAVTLFIMAAFVSILIHELGHALTGRHLGGGRALILLTSMGGLAINQGGRFNRQQRFWMIAAGPGAGFAFLALILAILSIAFGAPDTLRWVSAELFGLGLPDMAGKLVAFFNEKPFMYALLSNLVWINFWWGLLNLLPIMPLDGGQITELFVRPPRRVYLIGAIVAAAAAVFGFVKMESIFMALMFGYFAWKNHQGYKQLGG